MKVTQLVCDVQTMSMLDYELSNTSNIAKFLIRCSQLMDDCGLAYSQALKNKDLVSVYALERCVEKLKSLIEYTTTIYLDATKDWDGLLNALKDCNLPAIRWQIEIWRQTEITIGETK